MNNKIFFKNGLPKLLNSTNNILLKTKTKISTIKYEMSESHSPEPLIRENGAERERGVEKKEKIEKEG